MAPILHGDALYNKRKQKEKEFCRISIRQCGLPQNGHDFLWILYFFLYLLCTWIITVVKDCMIKLFTYS
jgi:hypothetical protein